MGINVTQDSILTCFPQEELLSSFVSPLSVMCILTWKQMKCLISMSATSVIYL